MIEKQRKDSNPKGIAQAEQPDSEVRVPVKRRQFTVAEKLRILDETDRCEAGQIGAVLRREGVYSSYLSNWRRQRAAGELNGQKGIKRGGKAEPQVEEMATLRCENERLQAELKQAKLIMEVQKKIYQLFGVPDQPEGGDR